ncbi:hypothetical protein O0I10_002779 [Lichtheimia ornata]|uniref:Uncharacterized protein n=1 Tax=Lichtheimia ornata TaxID=688661 RepID=A0AAD7VAB2_9FUNG|nr:uncharacterized protein O0I10_002779 [Lichtheimia ornata]KAJ8661513.1 hypothetical protein O0I10_002779 [Lichtheimia ornata]
MRLAILAFALFFVLLAFAQGDENRLALLLPSPPSSITPAAPTPETWYQVEPVANAYLKRQQEQAAAIPTSTVQQQQDDDDDDQTVVLNVTTVVVAANDNMTETTLKDANDSSSVIADQLEDNQNALHDMTLVVVLVCSISGTAVVICAIIFAWFKIRKHKKQREAKKAHHHHKHHSPCSSMHSTHSISPKPPFSNCNHEPCTKPENWQDAGGGAGNAVSGIHNNNNHDRLSSSDESTIIIPPHNAGSTSAQPAPSAPTEKELGESSSPLQLPHPSIYIHSSDSISSSTSIASSQQQQQQQEVYHHLDTIPPPPAYTPTPPPESNTPSLLLMGHPAAATASVPSSMERISLPVTTSAAPAAATLPGFTDSPLPYHNRNSEP